MTRFEKFKIYLKTEGVRDPIFWIMIFWTIFCCAITILVCVK